jgi:hypothetical protein
MAKVVLRYVGERDEWFKDVPARDLTQEDIDERGLDVKFLAASSIYKLAKEPAKKAEVENGNKGAS